MSQLDDAIRAEFDHAIDRAGLTVSAAQRAELVSTYADLQIQLQLLHSELRPDLEPATVFRLTNDGFGA